MTVPPIGAHVPVSGGLATAGLAYAGKVGAEAVQVFVSNPRGWSATDGDPAEDAALAAHAHSTGLPVFVHAPYLINLGSPNPVTLRRSVEALAHALRRAAAIGARGVVVHTGSAVAGARRADALGQVREHLLPLLDGLGDTGPDVLLEPMAGQGRSLCARVEDLGPYLAALRGHPRARVCLDTCHAFAAGHDLREPAGAAAMFAALADVAPGRLALVHANDSVGALGSRRDRHANIGAGAIGAQPFAALLRHPAAAVPWVVETPGGADAVTADIATLKRLRR